jgi:hypothetical protein
MSSLPLYLPRKTPPRYVHSSDSAPRSSSATSDRSARPEAQLPFPAMYGAPHSEKRTNQMAPRPPCTHSLDNNTPAASVPCPRLAREDRSTLDRTAASDLGIVKMTVFLRSSCAYSVRPAVCGSCSSKLPLLTCEFRRDESSCPRGTPSAERVSCVCISTRDRPLETAILNSNSEWALRRSSNLKA